MCCTRPVGDFCTACNTTLTCFHTYITGKPLLPDFFLEEGPEVLREKIMQGGGTPAFGGEVKTQKTSAGGSVAPVFDQIGSLLNEDLVKTMGGVFQFDLKGKKLVQPFQNVKDTEASVAGVRSNFSFCHNVFYSIY